MIKIISYLIILTYGSIAFADTCPKIPIDKGTPAPCSGYMLTVGAIEEASKLPKEIALLEDKLKLKDNEIALRDQKIELYGTSIDKKDVVITGLQNSLLEKDQNMQLRMLIGVGIGVGATAAIAIGLAFALGGAFKVVAK